MRRFSLVGILTLATLACTSTLASASSGWHVVGFKSAVREADRLALANAGATAITPYAGGYIAWLAERSVTRTRRIASVSAVEAVRPSQKLLPGAGRLALRATVVRYAGGRRTSEVVPLLGARAVSRLAQRADVLSIGPAPLGFLLEDEGTAQVVGGNAPSGNPKPGYLDFLQSLGVNGKGVRIAVVDDGIDETHPDLAGQVVDQVEYESPGTGENVTGHGTHVAGIVAGTGRALEQFGGAKDGDGLLYGLGVAPGASLIAMNGISELNPDEPKALLRQFGIDAASRGALAWNASWHTGEGTGIGYVENSRVLDSVVRDALPASAGNQSLAMIFSSGNEGSGETTVTSPKEAKNIITVGASRSYRTSGEAGDIASFSSRGPARDGRFLPTVTAPGENVMSARARPAGGLCFEPVDNGVSLLHSACSGTSMAAPHVSGAAAIIGQWWAAGRGGAAASPALLKALLVNTAVDLGAPDVPNPGEGWGQIDIGAVVRPGAGIVAFDQDQLFTKPGESRRLRVAALDPTLPIKVSLAWTDAPGTPPLRKDGESFPDKDPPALVNDLDLSVTRGAGVFSGNGLKAGVSIAGTAADRINNLENVFLVPGAGEVSVAVSAVALPGDGVPAAGDATDQDYALVISNARLLPDVKLKAKTKVKPKKRKTKRRKRS